MRRATGGLSCPSPSPSTPFRGGKSPAVAKVDTGLTPLKPRNSAVSAAVIGKMESEKAKLMGDVKQLRVEKAQLNNLLEEELAVRKMIQKESQKLVEDIKRTYENKIAKIKEDGKMKEDVGSMKQELIQELEGVVRQLRAEVQRLNAELQASKTKENEIQGKMSKSYRGSISMMQSHLSRKSLELETRIKEIETKHSDEVNLKIQEYERMIEDLKWTISERNAELEEVKGRLQESREAREATLDEMKASRKKYGATIMELEKKLDEAHEQIQNFQENQEKEENLSIQVEILDAQLDQTIKMNNDLTAKLDHLKQEKMDQESRIRELDALVLHLEKSLQDVEKQKQEYFEVTQEQLRNRQELLQADNSAQKLLEEQLEKSQRNCESIQESLTTERIRMKEMSANLAEVEKNFGLCRVDVRILTRDKTKLEEKLAKQKEEAEKSAAEFELIKEKNTALEKSVAEFEKTLAALKTKSEEDAFDLLQAQQMYAETKCEKEKLEIVLGDLKSEMAELKKQLEANDKLKMSITDREKLLKEKEQQLEESRRKIESLQTSVAVLKEASTVLDNQLKDFESVFEGKMQELDKAESAKAEMKAECSLLKENLKKTKIELNEVKSLKTFVEKRLAEVEGSLKEEENRSNGVVQSLSCRLQQMKDKNEELNSTVNKLTATLENVKTEKEHLQSLFERIKNDNGKLNEEISRTITTIVSLKENNIELKAGLEQSITKAENYKQRYELLSKDHDVLDLERCEREVQLQSTIRQQSKLIEFLQNQNEALATKKKDKKFLMFSSREKENKEPHTPLSTPNQMKYLGTPISARRTIPRPLTITPGATATPKRLIQEHKAVINLEEKAASLKQELILLKENSENGKCSGHKESVEADRPLDQLSSCPVKEDSVLFRDVEERLQINCAFLVSRDLYLLGCDEGLFSRRVNIESPAARVKIDGVDAVYQMELIPSLNSVVLIEGSGRRLLMSHMGMMRVCAEAASCSKPKLATSLVSDIQNCHLFEYQHMENGDVLLAVATDKELHILCWDKDCFKTLRSIDMRETITCMFMTPNTVIFGSDRIYELDTKHFQLEEFLDEADPTLYYLRFSCDVSPSFPVAILDVGMSNWTPQKGSFTKEFLLCFSDMGVFVDDYGRRTRSEDIVWSELPVAVAYRHPNLFIVHFSSVEVQKLTAESYTSRREIENGDTISEEKPIIPSSRFLALGTPRYLGPGSRISSIVVGSLEKHKTEIVEID